MRNWEKLQADENRLMNKHYTRGRQGHKINKIILHHNAGNLTIKGCWDTWQDREASAHYQVQSDGRIGQLVWDCDMAWHVGVESVNLTSIGIEHANNSSNPWTVSAKCLEEGAHLVAALCKFYKLSRPTWGKNVFGHRSFFATACPGELAGSQNREYMRRAQYWYDRMTGTKAATKPAPKPSFNVEQAARDVINGKYGNGDERKRRLGANYAKVQARVNQILLGKSAPRKPAGPSAAEIDRLADAVIRGEYGNGPERQRRLGSKYVAVQKRVNQKLGVR